MVGPADLARIAAEKHDAHAPGAYYTLPPQNAPIGTGLICSPIPHAVLNSTTEEFEIRSGPVLVLTHECDLDNPREFNTSVLFCPVITMEAFAQDFIARIGFDQTVRLLSAIAENRVSRVFYLPSGHVTLELGGFLYLNQITHSHVKYFARGTFESVLTEYGLSRLDWKLQNHLLRAKADLPPRTR
jgi:hypothetical protein